ncbi:MAG TPA: DUF1707 domain-containing protein [Mycobacteriales bacterium]|nr:DUF1707 domain-containing protein [Mycobacteriales bacterium]
MSDPLPALPDPVPSELLRVGDAERQQAVSALGEHFAAGRLDQDEYDTRVQAAYASRTRVDLQGLFGDLPEPAPFRPLPARAWAEGRAARDRVTRRPALAGVPVFPVLLVLAIVASAVLRFPVFPFVLFLWFGLGRRAWR